VHFRICESEIFQEFFHILRRFSVPRLSRIKDRLGRAFLGEKYQEDAPASLTQTATVETPITVNPTVLSNQTGVIPITQMTPEQITARNYAILAKVSHNPPLHEKFMEFCKGTWRIIGPIAFIVFTAGEVYYYIKHFLPSDNSLWTQVLLWGITLLIEIPFCIATYDLSGRKKRAAEAKNAGQEAPDKDTNGAITMWVIMALINIAGQMAFLFFITKAGNFNRDWPIYLFIAFRVVGVIIGDAYVAFFLSPAPLEVDQVVKHQTAQGEGFDRLNEATINRQLKESHAQLQLEQNKRTIDTERRNANFITRLNEMNAQQMLKSHAHMLELKGPRDDGEDM
jgi:hypothetical protein